MSHLRFYLPVLLHKLQSSHVGVRHACFLRLQSLPVLLLFITVGSCVDGSESQTHHLAIWAAGAAVILASGALQSLRAGGYM